MGLFDSIVEKGKQKYGEVVEAQMRAEEWDVYDIMYQIKRTSKNTERMGYGQALKIKAQKMDNRQLESLYDDAFSSKNSLAIAALGPILEERGLAYKDENGFYRKKG